jgi:nucleotide-binding universal stress UspA family protein
MTTYAATDSTAQMDGSHLGLAEPDLAPIVAAIDGSEASRAAIGEAVRLAVQLEAPIAFVYVRRGPSDVFGDPVYQQRLTKEMSRARRVLDRALAAAERAGVRAEGEILAGSPTRRIREFARDRNARLVVVGSRKRKLGRSVSSGVARADGPPVVVATRLQKLAPSGNELVRPFQEKVVAGGGPR